jgi:invasion protein IalB
MISPFMRFGALALAAVTLLSADPALAQATKPAAPAAGAPPPAGSPPPPTGPIKLDLQPMQNPWTKICGKDSSSGKEVCYTTRDFGQAADQPPTLALAVYQISGNEKRMARFLLPVGLLLRPGFRLILDKGEPIEGRFAVCFPNGCFAEAELNDTAMAALKKVATAAVVVRNQGNQEVTFNIPMKDFAAAFDGPAVDPKVLQQQNEQLQKQLEEKARVQREQLEKQPPAASAAPAPAPAPTPPK